MYYGVQYYPEHWPEERWSVDAAMMRDTGVNTVRMGEFAWSALEPREGDYYFDWLERALGLLHEHGIRTILCTPSRTPPPWVFLKYPGVVNTRLDGAQNRYGQRYTVGHAHPEFIDLSQRIDRAVIEHFAGHPAIVGWQIDNEVGSFNDCYCERCHNAFQAYLRRKYGSIEKLNASWGSHFWSFTLNDFDEVPLPASQPQLGLEYRRFLSSLNVDFARWRAELIRQIDPGKWITTNFQSAQARHTDYFQTAEHLDLNGMNYYPPRSPEFLLDYYRNGRSRLIVLEQMTRLQPVDSGEGWMRLWAYRSLAHGAEGTIFFRWRTCRWGQEQHADGILPHAGQANRRYLELQKMGQEIAQIGKLIEGTVPPSQVAIALSYESRWAMELSRFEAAMDSMAEAVSFHESFLRHNIPVDGLDPRRDLSPYRLVVAPRLFLVDQAIAENLQRFVFAGGTLLLTAGSGVVDEFNVSFDTPRPGPLREMAGIEVSDLSPLHEPVPLRSRVISGLSYGNAVILADEIHPQNAAVLAEYKSGWREGLPALTVNPHGQGRVLYLGTALDATGMDGLVDYACGLAGVGRGPETSCGVVVHERCSQDRRLLFLLNYTSTIETVSLAGNWQDALSGERGSKFSLKPVDARVLVSEDG
jgi:beta-galactosidase